MSELSRPASLYRFSVLGTAAVRMWRAWRILVPVVVVNAFVQALLVIPGIPPGPTPVFVLGALASFAVLVVSFGAVAAAMLDAVESQEDLRSVMSSLRRRGWPLMAWSLGLVTLVTVGLSVYVVPGLIVLAVTPYLLLAVVDGRSRPLVVNFRVIGARWWRWAITVVVMAVLCLVLWLLALIDGFFVGGPLGSFVGWLGLGLVASWFVCTWALLYRTVLPAGRSPLQVG